MLSLATDRVVLTLLLVSFVLPTLCAAAPDDPSSGLPDYALPTAEKIDPAAHRAGDPIRYREISRADFRAAKPPDRIAAHAARFGAYTCANLVPSAQEFEFIVGPDAGGGSVARLPEMEFYAVMDRSCSWWNPKAPDRMPEEYILQHEQIHFAIVEAEAQRLSGTLRTLEGRGSSPQASVDDLQGSMESLLHEAMEAVVQRSTKFDEDTSFQYEPERQERWLSELRAEIEQDR